ncbi:uncharacterized protein B0H18DRAFT_872502, partial [Fomitopsis serialis]|uniref:uncharacterized protein n=1 Tax=Fomitopsis serialis TaxID=139415 RepID=UPI0020087D51
LVRDEELWFPDGSIVLVAERRAFRVYHGILLRDSSVFSDLLSLPQPEDVNGIDGCPLVKLSDSAEDLRHLLRFLAQIQPYMLGLFFNVDFAPQIFMPAGEPIAFSAVAALVQLGHKYQLDIAEAEGLRLLKTVFTTSFRDQPDIIYRGLDSSDRPQTVQSVVRYRYRDAITAVNLARLTGEWSILPTAFYICCQLKAETLVLGNPRADGSKDCLSPSDLAICIDGKKGLMYAHAAGAHEVLYRTVGFIGPNGWYADCESGDCRDLRDEVFPNIIDASRFGENALWSWEEDIIEEDFCGVCQACLVAEAREQVRRVWLQLPEYFGLDAVSWKQLADLDAE